MPNLITNRRVVMAGGQVSSLLTGLVAYWKLDEASGTRNDSVGSSHLTDNATVTQATGKVGNAGQFTSANGEYLSIVDNAALSVGATSWTFSIWAYFDAKGANAGLAAKWGGTFNEWQLVYNSAADRFRLNVSNSAGTLTTVTDAVLGSPSTTTWYHVVVWYDSVNATANISINNGTATQTAAAVVISDSDSAFNLGAVSGGTFWNGRLDEAALWKRLLTATERTQLYNSGNGVTYPLFT